MPRQAGFYIEVPTDRVDLLEQTLLSIGVPFSPFENMIHFPKENRLESIFTGEDGQYTIDKVNQKMEEFGRPERIGREFHEMDHDTRSDLLETVTMQMEWQSEYEPDIIHLEPHIIENFLLRHPNP